MFLFEPETEFCSQEKLLCNFFCLLPDTGMLYFTADKASEVGSGSAIFQAGIRKPEPKTELTSVCGAETSLSTWTPLRHY